MRRASWLVTVTLCGGLLASPRAHAETRDGHLTLDTVLESVLVHHPVLGASRADVQEASAEARAARGEFDPVLTTQAKISPLGYYDPKRFDVLIEQPTPFMGASLYTGYRVTRGKVPAYYGELRTLDGGELRGGVRLPLLAGRATDARRIGIQRTEVQARAVAQGLERTVLELERSAAQSYYAWVAAGSKLRVLTALLTLAEQRDGQVRQRVDLGDVPAIEQLDNRRTILERARQVVLARRAVEKTSIELSLYLRDRQGEPRVPLETELPPTIEILHMPAVNPRIAEEKALLNRPELDQAEAMIEVARADQALASNGAQPRLDAFGEVSRDYGNASSELYPTLEPTVVEVGVNLSVPLLLRRARGKLAAADAKLTAAQQKSAFVRDRVRADVQDALSQVRAAEERANVARDGAEAARLVADGERERFMLGATTVLFVNIREQAAADASISLVDALEEVGLARVRLKTSMGERLARHPSMDETALEGNQSSR